jgi:hypothetical protein
MLEHGTSTDGLAPPHDVRTTRRLQIPRV